MRVDAAIRAIPIESVSRSPRPNIGVAMNNNESSVSVALSELMQLEEERVEVERSAARRASEQLAQAAAELGLSRQALYRRLDRYGITRD